MKWNDILAEIYSALMVNKVRTVLTMLGIVIGIGSVISMLAIGQGAQNSVESKIQSVGANLLQVMPGAQRTPGTRVASARGSAETLTLDDATAIESDPLVKAVSPELEGRYQIVGNGNNTNTTVDGVYPAYTEVRNVTMEQGSFISGEHVQQLSKVAVLGPTVRDDLFGENASVVGQKIRINGTQFTVIGVTAEKGGSGFGSQDDMIFVPLSTEQRFLVGGNYISTLGVEVAKENDMTEAQQEITNLLLSRHNIADPQKADFSILNQADLVATASSVTQTFTTLLSAVASISLIVGGIGIMNMMLTTVTERTKEIGLRRAIGAKRKDIRTQFLLEAVVLTLLSGLIGVLVGAGIAFAMSHFGIVEAQVSLSAVILAFGVSAAIGIIFGYYPARRAAELSPIEALRYE
ncbi:MAG TPA: ABC transporter permease [Candidatus Paceibacterota bacterium]|nr:ABC transporter permease [Candidatus Paceibacterota bacterium]